MVVARDLARDRKRRLGSGGILFRPLKLLGS
jgi:hypothetical protein